MPLRFLFSVKAEIREREQIVSDPEELFVVPAGLSGCAVFAPPLTRLSVGPRSPARLNLDFSARYPSKVDIPILVGTWSDLCGLFSLEAILLKDIARGYDRVKTA
jgi:hypothetical protein